jgi:four helix bundle protein
MAKGDDLQERLVELAATVIVTSKKLVKDDGGRHLAGQLLRSGTSPAPNYAEARGAESDRDFVHKLGIVLKELNETVVWLQIGVCSGLFAEDETKPLLEECRVLARIFAASINTVKRRIGSLPGPRG